jgi:hypothetical protein
MKNICVIRRASEILIRFFFNDDKFVVSRLIDGKAIPRVSEGRGVAGTWWALRA